MRTNKKGKRGGDIKENGKEGRIHEGEDPINTHWTESKGKKHFLDVLLTNFFKGLGHVQLYYNNKILLVFDGMNGFMS